MTVKQLAQRMGVDVKQLDFYLGSPCKDCRKFGGNNKPCDDCIVVAMVSVKEEGK